MRSSIALVTIDKTTRCHKPQDHKQVASDPLLLLSLIGLFNDGAVTDKVGIPGWL
jgi:hypothetical protein